jgi:ABC-type lipoprotein release transport system permease subunit
VKSTNNFRIFLTLFLDSTTKKFLVGVLLGLAFSIAVILSTVGIMDGFERSLRHGLKKSAGDITMKYTNGFFAVNERLQKELEEAEVINYAPLIETESFLIFNDESRGVQIKAVNPDYGQVVGIPLNFESNSVGIGSEIARIHKIKIGDEIVLAFGKGGDEFKNMPILKRFKVAQIITHGVFQRDARIVYTRLDEIQALMGLAKRVNLIAFNIDRTKISSGNDLQAIEAKLTDLRLRFQPEFFFRAYWREYGSLIEAVQAEKVLISLILQLIVVISVFNVLAFIYFINEKKSKELFLFRALGLSKKSMNNLWIKLVMMMWVVASIVSIGFVQLFRVMLLKLPFFALPAEVYHMPRIDIYLSLFDYVMVFALALVWMLLITYYLLRKLRNKSLLEGLRQEFA